MKLEPFQYDGDDFRKVCANVIVHMIVINFISSEILLNQGVSDIIVSIFEKCFPVKFTDFNYTDTAFNHSF